jgi:hypothetical protein
MLVLTLLLNAGALAATPLPPSIPCATPALHLDANHTRAVLPVDPPENGESKELRNTYTDLSNTIETENFVVWWGSSLGFTTEDVVALAESFELAWETEIDELGFQQPSGTESYKFNVYIGDTGGPSSLGANGYYYYDDDNWPMVVISSTLLGTDEGFVTAAHEFFHAIQDSTATYVYAGDAAWYFEASAVWAEARVYPESTEYVKFIPSLAFLPHLPISFFDYPDSLDLQEYHHYGASLFIKHLDEGYSPSLIQRSWGEAPIEGDPLAVLDALLAEESSSVEDEFFAFFDRNGTWDYPDEAAIEEELEARGGYDAPDSLRPSGELRIPIRTSLYSSFTPPMSFGGNYWSLHDVPDTFYVQIDAAIQGATWHISVMSQSGETHTTQAYTLSEIRSLEFSGHSESDETWLGVAVVTDNPSVLLYTLDITLQSEPTKPTSGSKHCGCATGQPTLRWTYLFFFFLGRRKQCNSTSIFFRSGRVLPRTVP